MVPSISFLTIFVQAFKIVVHSWKFTVIAIHLMRWLTNFYDFRFKSTVTVAIRIHPTDCHCWWISKIQSGREDTLEERYAIKFCFKLGKMPQKRMEFFRLPLEHLIWMWHKRFKETRESVRDDERCARSKEVNRLELIGQRVRVRVTMLRF